MPGRVRGDEGGQDGGFYTEPSARLWWANVGAHFIVCVTRCPDPHPAGARPEAVAVHGDGADGPAFSRCFSPASAEAKGRTFCRFLCDMG